MTIIDTLPAVDVSVRLSTSFRNADEYPDPTPYRRERYLGGFERCARNYIESQDGAEFCICISVRDDYSIDPWVYDSHGLLFFLYIDGQFMGKRFCQSKDFRKGGWDFTFFSRRHPNKDRTALVESRFKFQSIVTIDDEPTDSDIRRARDLGNIEIKVKLGNITGAPGRPTRSNLERDFREPDVDYFQIPEEALKGRPIYHGTSSLSDEKVSFTDPVNLPGGPPRHNVLKTSTGPLLATYSFKYRSHGKLSEALKIEDIISGTPSPEPMPQRRSVHFEESDAIPRFEDLHDDEVERLARERLRQLRDERLQMSSLKKRTYDDYCDLTQDNYEQADRPYKVLKMASGHEVIDLTSGY
ncbi:hypothetical protein ColLi_05405 [Colletotrichum liriopes]|uniref:DUF7918 domain-containing protein n=1 Tax=Colletotrichum liriopes TaxID=708192 RepID=A0AA37GKS6_9PEZI|nr:hypothetical protein ColLi_05405 [Colletotrichum liriopes]